MSTVAMSVKELLPLLVPVQDPSAPSQAALQAIGRHLTNTIQVPEKRLDAFEKLDVARMTRNTHPDSVVFLFAVGNQTPHSQVLVFKNWGPQPLGWVSTEYAHQAFAEEHFAHVFVGCETEHFYRTIVAVTRPELKRLEAEAVSRTSSSPAQQAVLIPPHPTPSRICPIAPMPSVSSAAPDKQACATTTVLQILANIDKLFAIENATELPLDGLPVLYASTYGTDIDCAACGIADVRELIDIADSRGDNVGVVGVSLCRGTAIGDVDIEVVYRGHQSAQPRTRSAPSMHDDRADGDGPRRLEAPSASNAVAAAAAAVAVTPAVGTIAAATTTAEMSPPSQSAVDDDSQSEPSTSLSDEGTALAAEEPLPFDPAPAPAPAPTPGPDPDLGNHGNGCDEIDDHNADDNNGWDNTNEHPTDESNTDDYYGSDDGSDGPGDQATFPSIATPESSLPAQLKYLVTVSDIPRAGWTASRMDSEYRAMFRAEERWWGHHGFDSASLAFQAFPDAIAMRPPGTKGTRFISAESKKAYTSILNTLLGLIPLAPDSVNSKTLCQQCMVELNVELSVFLGGDTYWRHWLRVLLAWPPTLAAGVESRPGIDGEILHRSGPKLNPAILDSPYSNQKNRAAGSSATLTPSSEQDRIASNLLGLIPVAPGSIHIGSLGSQYMTKHKVALTKALGGVKLSTFLEKYPMLASTVKSRPGTGDHDILSRIAFKLTPPPSTAPERDHDAIARNLLSILPDAPESIEICQVGGLYAASFKIALSKALSGIKPAAFAEQHPILASRITVEHVGGLIHMSRKEHAPPPASAAAPPTTVSSPLATNVAAIDDMVPFLAKQQPDNELRGVELTNFYEAFPQYKDRGLKLKQLATSFPGKLQWVQSPNPRENKIALVRRHKAEFQPFAQDTVEFHEGDGGVAATEMSPPSTFGGGDQPETPASLSDENTARATGLPFDPVPDSASDPDPDLDPDTGCEAINSAWVQQGADVDVATDGDGTSDEPSHLPVSPELRVLPRSALFALLTGSSNPSAHPRAEAVGDPSASKPIESYDDVSPLARPSALSSPPPRLSAHTADQRAAITGLPVIQRKYAAPQPARNTLPFGQSAPLLPRPAPAHTTDQRAAITGLQMLQRKFGQRPWPSTKAQFRAFVASVRPGDHAWFHQWLLSHRSDQPAWSQAKVIKSGCKLLMQQYKRMGCYTGNIKALRWAKGVVSKIVTSDMASISTTDIAVDSHPSEATDAGPTTAGIKKTLIKMIATAEELAGLTEAAPFTTGGPDDLGFTANGETIVAIDCEGVPDHLHLVQVATRSLTMVFDCVELGADVVCDALRELLENPDVIKLFHDLHMDTVALAEFGAVEQLRGALDTQLAMESLTGELHMGFNQMLARLDLPGHPTKTSMKATMQASWRQVGTSLFAQRPLPSDVLHYAADDVSLLVDAQDKLAEVLGPEAWASVQRASDARAFAAQKTHGARQICFDVANDYAIASRELLHEQRPGDMVAPTPLEVSDDTAVLLDMLPDDFAETLAGQTAKLSDINIDKGRVPHAWVDGQRVFLGGEGREVQDSDICAIVDGLGKFGFGADNRAGLERQLHRISAIRNRHQKIIGLTMRVGRHVTGNATMISDLLFADSTRSILFLGEPGSGKTTVVREATRILAERTNVCIVDTSNEIAGDGDVPHPCVGFARRMMVESLDEQASVMIECVQNHTPEAMVIDEIGRPTEVEAARTCKQRGVRLIASAHGDLRKLIKNPKLRGLVGGVESVTLGDAQAKLEQKNAGKPGGLQKVKSQRSGAPTFDVIVELRRGAHHEWRVVLDVADAVDRILDGQSYKTQLRSRNPDTGAMQMRLEHA